MFGAWLLVAFVERAGPRRRTGRTRRSRTQRRKRAGARSRARTGGRGPEPEPEPEPEPRNLSPSPNPSRYSWPCRARFQNRNRARARARAGARRRTADAARPDTARVEPLGARAPGREKDGEPPGSRSGRCSYCTCGSSRMPPASCRSSSTRSCARRSADLAELARERRLGAASGRSRRCRPPGGNRLAGAHLARTARPSRPPAARPGCRGAGTRRSPAPSAALRPADPLRYPAEPGTIGRHGAPSCRAASSIYVSYKDSPHILTKVIDRRPVVPGSKFDLTPQARRAARRRRGRSASAGSSRAEAWLQ